MKYIFVAIILFGITGCYNSTMKIRFVNNTKGVVHVMNKSHHYIDINHSKVVSSSLVLFPVQEKYDYFFIKQNGIRKKYILDIDTFYTDKIHKFNYKHHFPPLRIEIGKNVDIVYPETARITLPEVKKNKSYDIGRDKLLQKVE